MVGAAEQWPWSSACAHSSGEGDNGLLDLAACRRWSGLEHWAEILATGGYTAEGELLRRATAGRFPWEDDAFLRILSLPRSVRSGRSASAPANLGRERRRADGYGSCPPDPPEFANGASGKVNRQIGFRDCLLVYLRLLTRNASAVTGGIDT